MPYFFKENDLNLLLIHIPKTGGTSIETYFSKKYNIPLNTKCYYSNKDSEFFNNISLQHHTFKSIKLNRLIFNIDFNNLNIIAIVRNPYERLLSELFWRRKINKKPIYSTKEEVNLSIKDIFNKYKQNNDIYDNHIRPQYEFILDIDDKICSEIKIFKTETLTKDMIEDGWTDFDLKLNASKVSHNIEDLLNDESIELINDFYLKDFEIFNYEMIRKN